MAIQSLSVRKKSQTLVWLPSTSLTKKETEHPRWWSLSAMAVEVATAAEVAATVVVGADTVAAAMVAVAAAMVVAAADA
jgi:hypothetical protein